MIKILITQAGTGWSGLTKTEQAKWLSAAGKELLAQGISQWFGVRWDSKEEKNRELATERNAWGKPFLVCHPEKKKAMQSGWEPPCRKALERKKRKVSAAGLSLCRGIRERCGPENRKR